jgi:hypothetical protein
MSLIKIDGKTYDVGEVELRRGAEIIYDPLTKGTMLDFSEVDDAAATKYIYSLRIEPKHGVSGESKEYDDFYYDITSPKSVRLVELPFGQGTISFPAKIKSAADSLKRRNEGKSKWTGLTVEFLPVKPQRY